MSTEVNGYGNSRSTSSSFSESVTSELPPEQSTQIRTILNHSPPILTSNSSLSETASNISSVSSGHSEEITKLYNMCVDTTCLLALQDKRLTQLEKERAEKEKKLVVTQKDKIALEMKKLREKIATKRWQITRDLECALSLKQVTLQSGYSWLSQAAYEGDVDTLLLLIAAGGQLENEDEEGYTPLQRAASSGKIDAVKLLVAGEAKLEVQRKDKFYEQTALMIAAERGYLEIVEFLIAVGANIYAPNKSGQTAIMFAAQQGNLKIVKQLFDLNSILLQDNNGCTAWQLAIEADQPDVVQFFIEFIPIDNINEFALMLAAKTGSLKTMAFLISAKKADVNFQGANGTTALIAACQSKHKKYAETVQYLIEAKALLDHQDKDGRTALMYCLKSSSFDHINALCLLLQSKAKLDILDKVNKRALDYADNEEQICLLVAGGAPLNEEFIKRSGGKALLYASKRGNVDAIGHLVKAKVNPDVQDSDGWTPLMHATANGKEEIVRQLNDAKASLNLQNNQGETAQTLARKGHNSNIKTLLGADDGPQSSCIIL